MSFLTARRDQNFVRMCPNALIRQNTPNWTFDKTFVIHVEYIAPPRRNAVRLKFVKKSRAQTSERGFLFLCDLYVGSMFPIRDRLWSTRSGPACLRLRTGDSKV
jgi:hypothetical protein